MYTYFETGDGKVFLAYEEAVNHAIRFRLRHGFRVVVMTDIGVCPMRRFTIDGTTEHGELSGHATRGPWAVFDSIKQDWLITGLPYWRAVLICRLLTK